MTDGQFVTRAELERLEDKIDRIDTGGTRGVGVLAVQVQELAKDLAAHERSHEIERQQRVSGRRWLITTIIAGISLLASSNIGIWITIIQGHHL